VELQTNATIKNMSEKILKKNDYANIWKWQEFSFKENMLETMDDLIPALLKIQNDTQNNKFNFALVIITTTPNREKITPEI